MEYHISLPIKKEDIEKLRVGDFVYLTGPMLTARDAAHKRLCEALERGEELPVDLLGQAVTIWGRRLRLPGM